MPFNQPTNCILGTQLVAVAIRIGFALFHIFGWKCEILAKNWQTPQNGTFYKIGCHGNQRCSTSPLTTLNKWHNVTLLTVKI